MTTPFRNRVHRRAFLSGAAAAASVFTIVPRHVLGGPRFVAPSDKLNIGFIGAGGRGGENVIKFSSQTHAAFCDVDPERAKKTFDRLPNVKRYTDFRVMLDEEKNLDAVCVAIPDHTHCIAALSVIERNIHLYCEKPLAARVSEVRAMCAAAKEAGIVTQMGNEGTSAPGLRRAAELVQAGVIGDVREVHVWTNRPGWPQGIERPGEMPIPEGFDWNLWLSVAPFRPYNRAYAPRDWRGWIDFGTGALGDMACHTANLPYMALALRTPSRIEPQSSGYFPETFPLWSILTYHFPERANPAGGNFAPCTMTWYDGGKLPPAELLPGVKLDTSGCLLIGSKGTLYSPKEYGIKITLHPEKDFKDFDIEKDGPPQSIPRSPGHHREFIEAVKGGPKPMANFDYAAPLSELVLLGNVAIRAAGPIDWDGNHVTNNPAADAFLTREYRKEYVGTKPPKGMPG